ncbi:MAG TPA: nucleotide disphospho-sugar-binding domain-containing protein [Sporichthyaceae bacterium]|jgi:MGT family glycosyltransferase|nr:nucleotide disphospho-sugar-binding domain-containing protein [Sporichthyaceae bacterium]
MSRFLTVVPPLVGHINPTLGVAAELVARGHTVAWAGMPEIVERLAGPRARVFDCAVPRDSSGELLQRPAGQRGLAAFQFLWQEFLIPLGEMMTPGVLAAVEQFQPDVLIVDQQTVAGALVAERLGLPWVTSATTSAEFTGPLDSVPLLDAWVTELFAELRTRTGAAADGVDPRFSPHLIIAFTSPELAGSPRVQCGPIRFVGPSIEARPTLGGFPWQWRDRNRKLALVSLGTANPGAGSRFLTTALEALSERSARLQGVIVDPSRLLGRRPATADVLVLPAVPQLELMPYCSAVVCHAGHNTVCEALRYGVPLVVAPMCDDQPVIANQVVTAGAGVRVPFGRITSERLGQALDRVLDDPLHRKCAQHVGESFQAAGGAVAAARYIEAMALVAVA